MSKFDVLRASLLVCLSCVLVSCGSIRFYQHSEALVFQGSALDTVNLQVGETKKVVKHTAGMMSIGGGYIQGIYVEDPSVVSVRYGKDGKGDRFDSLQTMTGLKPGVTRAVYGNRLGSPPDFSQGATNDLQGRLFVIEVVDERH